MRLDLEKCPIIQLKSLINNINDIFHDQKMNQDLPKFVQFKLNHIGKGKYRLTAEQYDSETYKHLKTKELNVGNRYDLTHFVFDKFYTVKEGS